MADCPVDAMLVDEVAYRTWRKWRAWAERDDIVQELWCWACGRDDVDSLEGPALGTALRDVAERYCRREKAARSGYRPADEAFYTLPVLRELIGAAGAGPATRRGVDDSSVKASRRGAAGPSMEYETMIMDVVAGMAGLSAEDRWLLVSIYQHGTTYADMAVQMETTEDQVNNATARAIRRLQRALGGRKPSMR